MDVRRSCGVDWMWFDAAKTVGNWVRWYWVDDHPFLPVPHSFASEIWDEVHWMDPEVGIPWNNSPTYDKGAPPFPEPPALGYCGEDDWWANGQPSDAPPTVRVDGQSVCCGAGLRGPYDLSYASSYDRVRNA